MRQLISPIYGAMNWRNIANEIRRAMLAAQVTD